MRVFYFNITYRCNSNCLFCAANHPLYHDENEMTLDEFRAVLEQNEVVAGDRVIINGGEPTVHRQFWMILDEVARRGATIDLFTNGKLLANEENVRRLLRYEGIHIRIPLFGSNAEKHDYLTGMKGNFDATVQGLDWLCKYLKQGQTLEVKLLMSKITIDDNENIYNLICKRWHHPAVRISLNPLLISDCVTQQRDLFIEQYESMMIKSEHLIRRALAEKVDFSVALVPYCSYPNDELLQMCRGRKAGGTFFYASPGCRKDVQEFEWKKPCRACIYANECNGYSKNYVNYFGAEVMKPITVQ